MTRYDWSAITLGAELEIADCDRHMELPEGNTWSTSDYTIANSTGVGNDPRGEINRYGGEIQTRPCNSAEELTDLTLALYAHLGDYSFNYTTNLHVHICVPGLKDNLDDLKYLLRWFYVYGERYYAWVDPIPEETRQKYDYREEIYRAAKKREVRRKRSHAFVIKHEPYKAAMAATTPEEFFEAHGRLMPDGRRLEALVSRAGVNLRSMKREAGTIEFRHFTMTDDRDKLLSMYSWPQKILYALLEDRMLWNEIKRKYRYDINFQPFHPFDYNLDRIFQLTRCNRRKVASKWVSKLIADGRLKPEDVS